MKFVCLKFIIGDAGFLQTVVTEEVAKRTVDGFINNTLPSVVGEPQGGGPLGEHGWAIQTSKITAVHYFDIPPQNLPPQAASVPPGFRKVPPTTSGLNLP